YLSASRADKGRLPKVNQPPATLSRSRRLTAETRPRHFKSHTAGQAVAGATAVGGDRPSHFSGCAYSHHGRTDVESNAHGNAPAAGYSPAFEGSRGQHHLHFA